MMQADDISRLVRRHNALQMLVCVSAAMISAALWVVSFWIFRWLFYVPAVAFGLGNAWNISFYVAWGMMLLLTIEGFHYARPLFDLAEYHRSGYFDNVLSESPTGRAVTARYGNPLGLAWLVSQTVFCAPRTTVRAVQALRSRIPLDEADSAAASARIYNDLHAQRRWVAASAFSGNELAIGLLIRLELIWTDVQDGEPSVRIPPGT